MTDLARKTTDIPPDPSQPALVTEFSFEIQLRQRVDLVGFYLSAGDNVREQYVRFITENTEGYADWEWPTAFLINWMCEDLTVDSGLGWRPGVVDSESDDVEPDPWPSVLRMTGDTQTRYENFKESHAEHLLERVAWMKAAHKVALNIEDSEEDLADLARQPGPNDIPIPFEA